MAPAAQDRRKVHTVTTTIRKQHESEAATAEDTLHTNNGAAEQPSPSKTTDSYRSSSTFNWASATPDVHVTRHFPIPQIQGIVPGIHYALHVDNASPSSPHSLRPSHDVTSTVPIMLLTSAPPPPRHSKYPRISPPGFLYPEEIVPHTAISAQTSNPLQYQDSVRHNKSPYHSDIMSRMDYELSYLPTGYKLLFVGTLAIMVLGVVWAVMVWAVNAWMDMRSVTNKGKRTRKRRAKSTGEEKRPIDKVSKYAHRHDGSSETWVDMATNMDMDSDSAVTSAAQVPFSYLGNNGHIGENIEMKYRPRNKPSQFNRPRSRPIHTEARDRTHTFHCRIPSPPSANSRSNHPPTPIARARHSPTPSVASSPVNPFLDPSPNGSLQPGTGGVLVKRTSSEWKTERAAFFATKTATSVPVSRSVSPAPSHTNDHSSQTFELDISDIEALEAGTAPLTGRRQPQSEFNHSFTGSGLVEKSKSWIDEGVGFVDGAVSAVAAQIRRWTDDDGGDESLLLPYTRQGREGDECRMRDASCSP
ncbi:unnamed protein product [Alternaria burnsii]|nr:unnamed protein product [Alternaria burnsii]